MSKNAIRLAVLLLTATVCLWGCSPRRTDVPMTVKGDFVTWQGPFSDEVLQDGIDEYKKACIPFSVTGTDMPVTVPVGQADTLSVSRLSPVGEGYEELDRYIDLSVHCQYDREAGELQVDTGWRNDPSDWANRYDTWSYLIRTVTEGKETYWYFRVTFTS